MHDPQYGSLKSNRVHCGKECHFENIEVWFQHGDVFCRPAALLRPDSFVSCVHVTLLLLPFPDNSTFKLKFNNC